MLHYQHSYYIICVTVYINYLVVDTVNIYRSGTVNSKSFVGKVLLRIKWKFELNDTL